MNFQYIPYLWLLAISLFILLFLSFYAYRYRKVRGAKAFGLSMLIFAFWVICHGLEMAGTDLSTKLFWANMQYFSYTTIHIAWLYMVLQFTGYTRWCSPGRVLLLLLIPTIVIILVWTDHYHGLIRYGFRLDYGGSFPVINKSYGPLYWIHPIYGYTINLISIFLITRAVLIHKSIFRMQALALLVSPLLSFLSSVLYVLSLSPVKRFDITPVFLGFSGIIAAIGLFKYQLFALVPVARNIAMDNMNMGVLILDSTNAVVDMNVMAERMFEIKKEDIIGSTAEGIFSRIGIEFKNLDKEKKDYQVVSKNKAAEFIYQFQLLPIFNKQQKRAGSIILGEDVTETRDARLQLMERNRKIAVSRERERMARDLHDNLGQVMGFINLQAQGIRNELKKEGGRALDELTRLIKVTQSAHDDIRKYIEDTKKPAEIKIDIIYELQEIVKRFKNHTGMEFQLNINNYTEEIAEELSIDDQNNILNIIKESLNNIRKYSKADKVKLEFLVNNNQLKIEITDNGIGFDMNQKRSNDKFGIDFMEARAEEIGGNLEIQSVMDEGTSVYLLIDLC